MIRKVFLALALCAMISPAAEARGHRGHPQQHWHRSQVTRGYRGSSGGYRRSNYGSGRRSGYRGNSGRRSYGMGSYSRGGYGGRRSYWGGNYVNRVNRQKNAAQYASQRAQQQAERQRYSQSQLTPPARLTASQIDPTTGAITWPTLLRGETYATYRTELQNMFTKRAKSGVTPELTSKIAYSVGEMKTELQKHVSGSSPTDYVAARKFLDSLAYEGTLPTGDAPAAVPPATTTSAATTN